MIMTHGQGAAHTHKHTPAPLRHFVLATQLWPPRMHAYRAFPGCRTLRYLGLASNRITMHACTVLAAGMRVTRALDRLVLEDNPIGLDGGVAIVEALARGYVRCVILTNCNFGNAGLALKRAEPPPPAAGSKLPQAAAAASASSAPAAFDVKRPNHMYRLQLARVADYNVAGTLVQYWSHDTSPGGPWKSASLDGKVRAGHHNQGSSTAMLRRCCEENRA